MNEKRSLWTRQATMVFFNSNKNSWLSVDLLRVEAKYFLCEEAIQLQQRPFLRGHSYAYIWCKKKKELRIRTVKDKAWSKVNWSGAKHSSFGRCTNALGWYGHAPTLFLTPAHFTHRNATPHYHGVISTDNIWQQVFRFYKERINFISNEFNTCQIKWTSSCNQCYYQK